MGFPAGAQTTVLTMALGFVDGSGERETVTITPSVPQIVSTALNDIREGDPVLVTSDRGTGTASVRLLNTDASGYNPSGWTYTIQRGNRTPYSISLPSSLGATADLADLTPVTSSPGTYDLLIHASELGNSATRNVGTTAGTVAAGDDPRFNSASPWVFDITAAAYGAVCDLRTATDAAITSGTKVLTCASAPFGGGAITVGMSVGIKGAGPAGVTWYRSTVASVDSTSQVTLVDNASTTVSGGLVVWGTNNQTAIQAAVNAAEAYLAAGHTYAQVWTPGACVIDGPLNTSKSGNGQIVFGVYPTTAVKKILHFKGVKGSSAVRHWEQLVPQTGGSCWVSFGAYASASAQTTDINANGNPAVLCGPNEGTSNGLAYGASARYSNVMCVLEDMAILTAHSVSGWTYGAANLYGCANAHVEDFAYGTAGMYAAGDYSNPNTFADGLSIGLLMPSAGNNDHNVMRNMSCGGGYTYGVFLTEHSLADRLMVLYCWAGVCPVGTYAGSVGASHAMKVMQASVESCSHELYIIGPAAQGVGPIVDIDQLQTESGSPNIDGNSTGALMAALGRVKLTGLYTQSGVSMAQPCGIELVDGGVPSGIRRVTAGFTVRPIDRTLVCDTAGGGFTGTLPDADVNAVTYVFKNVGSNSLTVATTSSQLIYTTSGTGATTATVATGGTLRVQAMYNGSAWGWYAV